MIDLNKAPEGATHYGLIGACGVMWYFIAGDSYRFYDEGKKGWSVLMSMPTVWTVVKIGNWTIYNNTTPLKELSDEQASLVVNHLRQGLPSQYLDHRTWADKPIGSSLINTNTAYRAKQKTERELFIDEWSSKITTNEYNGGNVRSLVGQMFDDVNGIK